MFASRRSDFVILLSFVIHNVTPIRIIVNSEMKKKAKIFKLRTGTKIFRLTKPELSAQHEQEKTPPDEGGAEVWDLSKE